MEKLTIKELEDYMKTPLTNLRGGKIFQMRMVNELLMYKKLEEQIGCPLEVRCKLYNGMKIFYQDNQEYCVYQIDEKFIKVSLVRKYYQMINNEPAKCLVLHYNDYKKTWWLKADRSE